MCLDHHFDAKSERLAAVGGALLSWVSSFVLYGFGQLVENSDVIAGRHVTNIKGFSQNQKKQHKNSKKESTYQRSRTQKQLLGRRIHKYSYRDITCPNCGEELSYYKKSK